MGRHGRDPRSERELAQAVSHPLRLLILKISARERNRCLSVKELKAVLVTTPGWGHVKAKEVIYHRNCLLDAGLIPAR
jgi:hypothetical protein